MRTWLQIAWQFGVPISELKDRLSAEEFRLWTVWLSSEPRGESRSDLHQARLLQMLANLNRSSKQRPYTTKDFMLQFREQEEQPRRRLSGAELLQKFAAATGMIVQPKDPK